MCFHLIQYNIYLLRKYVTVLSMVLSWIRKEHACRLCIACLFRLPYIFTMNVPVGEAEI